MMSPFEVTVASRWSRRLAMVTAAAAMSLTLRAQSPPRAPDGHPDLQCTWKFSRLTPLGRPAQFAEKPFLTEAEAAEFERQAVERNDADRRRDTAEADGGPGHHNARDHPGNQS